MMDKRRKAGHRRISDRERWRNLCEALAEDALRASPPHSGEHFPRPSEEDWRKLCNWPREMDEPSAAEADQESNPDGVFSIFTRERSEAEARKAERLFMRDIAREENPEAVKKEIPPEKKAVKKATVKKTGPKTPGS